MNAQSNTPPRIAHLIQYFEVGGLERMVSSLAAGRAPGSTVVIAYERDGAFRAQLEAAGARTYFIPKTDGLDPSLPHQVAEILASEAIDVLHTHHLGPYMYGVLAAAEVNVPVVHTEHSVEFYDTARRRAIGKLMHHTAHVVSCSDAVADWRKDNLGTRGAVIPNGVHVPAEPVFTAARANARRRLGLFPIGPIIGSVARLAPEKNHRLLLDAFAELRDRIPSARLVLVGDGPERDNLERQARELEIADAVFFLGMRSDVPWILPAFDVIALSSEREGLPLSLLEAMAFGIPAVATAVGGIPALLENGGGFAVAQSADALADAFEATIDSETTRRKIGREARALIQHKYSEEAMVASYERTYRRVLGKHRRGSGLTGIGRRSLANALTLAANAA